MNKITTATLLFLFTFAFVNAQKVDLDRFNYTFEYRDLPHSYFNPKLNSYFVLVDASGEGMSPEVIASKIDLQGYKKVDNNGDVRVSLHFDDLTIDNNKVVENVTETKEKDGSTKKNYSYYVSVDYTINGSYMVNELSGTPIIKSTPLFSGKKSWSSQTFKSNGDANSYFATNKKAIKNNLTNERINEAVTEVNRSINVALGFPVMKVGSYLWLNDSKKHPESDIMKGKWNEVKPVIEGITANSLTEDQKSKIMDFIKYFDELKTKYATDDKGDAKLRYAAFYNNATLYLILDNPEKAAKEADGLVANDYDPKDGKQLKEQADKLTELFTKNNLYSRHFNAAESRPYKK